MVRILSATLLILFASSAHADEIFSDDSHGGKLHVASNFTCPAKIGPFERDAVGERDPQANVVYCAYSERDGVYGTILLRPLTGPYDAKASLAGAFEEAQSTGGRMISELQIKLGPRAAPVPIYARTYESAKLTDERYRVLYSGAAIGNWGVELTIEYADPRDLVSERDFLNAVYAAAARQIGASPH
jgi:hypothetical protein